MNSIRLVKYIKDKLGINKKNYSHEISPEDVLLDSSNLPNFDTHQFEGRLTAPISKFTLIFLGIFFSSCTLFFLLRAWNLQITKGDDFAIRSENNRLNHTPIFAARGIIYDRNGKELAWNAPERDDSSLLERRYATSTGIAHVVGYVHYPSKDSAGFYYREDFEGVTGAEKFFNKELQGKNGLNIIEVDARGAVKSKNIIDPPEQGKDVNLSIDLGVQHALHESIKNVAKTVGFKGGAGVIMDIHTGEIIAMTSYPEFDPDIMSKSDDVEKVNSFLKDKNKPFLDRAMTGLYTPGSIVKPYVALGALAENIINPNTKISSPGSISIPNDYDPTKFTVFGDWKVHGYVNMKDAIAVSSDVYFYEVGGGYKDLKGLGITKLAYYFKQFGFGSAINNGMIKTPEGVVPTPEWKLKVFNESWRLGNTYHTSIGQYGFQVTPLHMARSVAALANYGNVIEPTIIKAEKGVSTVKIDNVVNVDPENFKIVLEGMRQSVVSGTCGSINMPYVQMAAKSGTAELGVSKENVNSWMTGFFPYNNPKYSFAVVMESGSRHNLIGSGSVMRGLLEWMHVNAPEYLN